MDEHEEPDMLQRPLCARTVAVSVAVLVIGLPGVCKGRPDGRVQDDPGCEASGSDTFSSAGWSASHARRW
ncbi:predicted protein [Streptomyces iranensis]|uniref:Uncharacterized protein n=1 Tax=Streptomyces iranensis TaxID=576784 RepID=A0A060ZMB3_9ACTN|nr:predicted protein [Streptomyces iranensis]